MKIKISNFIVPVNHQQNLQESVLRQYCIHSGDVLEFKILRAAIDARKRQNIVYNYQIYIDLKNDDSQLLSLPNVSLAKPKPELQYARWGFAHPPVVVGFGPAGMFAALYLARCHANPIIIERGSQIEKRKSDVANFLNNKQLDENSNIQFGEGGAGAFSDGKLTTNISSEWIDFVLQEFYLHGATEDVTYMSNPHVGTDYLEIVVKKIREEIQSLGGTFHFNTTFTDFQKENDVINILLNNKLNIKTNHLLLCLGHSARDTIRMLFSKGLQMEAKSFSMGVRIEHLQSKIDEMQYGRFASFLPPASYKGVVHFPERSVYTFCMCPGGTVMASTSEKNSIVTNGMSVKKRDGKNANAALLVGINPSDFYVNSPLAGMQYQEKYERMAFNIARNYQAPCNLLAEFEEGKVATQARSITPSYPHGVVYCDLRQCLPDFVVTSLRKSLPEFDKKLKGFRDADAVLTGIETRSSSPVRILRNEQRESNIAGIYPVGEGAGYAGGITSAAIDGLKTAMMIVKEGLL
ncbi:MAG: FAD-binding protein [Bacteroidales bacterium]|nr:FAD-binding protein [Bacteroidales bacterium]